MVGNGRDFEQNKNNSYMVNDKWHKHQYRTVSRTLVQEVEGKFPVLVFIRDQDKHRNILFFECPNPVY